MIELDMTTLTLVSGAILPLLVSLVVKANVASRVKAYLNVALSVVTGGIAFLVTNNGAVRWQELVNAMILAYLASNVAYNGTYKPTGITEKISQATANIGIGSPAPPVPESPPEGPVPPTATQSTE